MRRYSFIFHISRAYSDIIMLALLAGGGGKILWHLSVNTDDSAGFISVGGDIAGLLAYFGFIFFGCFFFWLRADAFWRSLHPVNVGLAQLFFPRYFSTASEYLMTIFIPALVAAVAAALLAPRLLKLNPRLLLFMAVLTLIAGFQLPWGVYRIYALNGLGVFLIGIGVTALLTRTDALKKCKRQRTTKAKRRQQSASTTPRPQNQSDVPV